jgi:CDP-glycerol glycerophosphotransferase (TagB/SpsB family)
MANYLFYCQELYCLSILRPVQEVIRENGWKAAWFFENPDKGPDCLTPDEHRIPDVKAVLQYDPDAVLAPGNLVPDFFPGVKVQIFHGLADDATGKKGHYKIRGFFDLYCTRSPAETRIFQELARKKGHFDVAETGWPKLDPLFQRHDGLKNELNTSKPVVLFASTFSPSLSQARVLVEPISRLAATGRYHFLVTLHPKTRPQIQDRYRRLAGPNLKFFESHENVIPLLQAADVMLCDTSSIGLEFMLLDKPLVTFRNKMPGPHLINVVSETDIAGALDAALSRPPQLMAEAGRFAEQIHPRKDGNSSRRVLDAVNRLMEKGLDHLKPKPMNLYRRLRMRQRLGYYPPLSGASSR